MIVQTGLDDYSVAHAEPAFKDQISEIGLVSTPHRGYDYAVASTEKVWLNAPSSVSVTSPSNVEPSLSYW